MKTCKTCLKTKGYEEFFLNARRLKDGSQSPRAHCKVCYMEKYPAVRPTKEKRRAQQVAWLRKKPGYGAASAKRFRTLNRSKIRAWNAESKAAKIKATPPWITSGQRKEMQRIYADCPAGMHVDHIVPLRAKEVRGLHVPWNLQYLTPAANMAKGNRKIG